MILLLYSLILLGLAALPFALVTRNLSLFDRAPNEIPEQESGNREGEQPISVLIPARNEAQGIAQAVESILASDHSCFEIVVLDDHSTDTTAEIVRSLAARDHRVRLESSTYLPEGWNGKQHACWQLANHARYDCFLFLDADVHVRPDGLRRVQAMFHQCDVALISGFPRQITETISEELLVPMMYFILLGYLPLEQMRASAKPEFGAGCGQLFMAQRAAYFETGGHQSIHGSRHDGLKLPRSFRAAGYKTDLFDASDIAEVRMYCGRQEVTLGVLKNATEGIASGRLIGLFTVFLVGGSVLPPLSFGYALWLNWGSMYEPTRFWSTMLLGLASCMTFLPPYQIAQQLGRSKKYVWLHPIAVAWFVALQWVAFLRQLCGLKAIPWRGRN